jgi:acyl dehydratase
VVWESRSTYLARHRTDGRAARPREDGKPLPPVAEWRLGDDVGRRYGAVSGDRNPIHLHPLTARLFGFPRAIAHGMWTAARCLAAYGIPDVVEVRAEFRAPVLLPGTVTYAAEGERFELRGDGDRVHLTGSVYPA